MQPDFLPFYQPTDALHKLYGGGYLGNFYPVKVTININENKYTFPTTEHAFQASKSENDETIQLFTDSDLKPGQAFKLGRQVDMRKDWDDVKLKVMEDIVYAKFDQNPELKKLLLETGERYLVEHTPFKGRDKYWADDHDGKGGNNLGIILMKVRKRLGGVGVIKPTNNYRKWLKDQ